MSIGFVLPALSLGLGSVVIRPNLRGFFPDSGQALIPQAVTEEVHHDELMITDHPVERGSNISDHAYKLPAEVVIRFGFSDSPSSNPSGILSAAASQALNVATALNPGIGFLTGNALDAVGSLLSGNGISQIKDIYDKIIQLQGSIIPFTVLTGKRKYPNMLFKSITVTTDTTSENSLMITATCRQIITANTQTVSVPINTQAQGLPESTTPSQKLGSKSLTGAEGRYIA